MSDPKNTNLKHRILFNKGEAYASPLSTILRKTLDIFSKIKHVPHPKNTNSNNGILFDEGEAHDLPPSTSLRKILDISSKIRHVPHL